VIPCGCAGPQPITLSPQERATEPALDIGDPAPTLRVSEWVRGGPVSAFEPGRVYMLDFWATWCAPCLASMPATAEFERRHADELTVIAFTTLDGNNTRRRIRSIVAKMGEAMPSTVAVDEGDATAAAYRTAARETALPRAFIIDSDGRVAWIGHPADAHDVLESVLAGTWDLEAARERRRTDALERTVAAGLIEQLRNIPRSDAATALPLWEQLRSLRPANRLWSPPSAADARVIKCLVALGRLDEAMRTADAAAAQWADDAVALAGLSIAIEPADGQRADELADAALSLIDARAAAPVPSDPWERYLLDAEREQDAGTLTVLAMLHHARGRNEVATTLIRRALESPAAARNPGWRGRLRETLDVYESKSRTP